MRLLPLLACAAGCAAPPAARVRELATARYEVRVGETAVATSDLRLTTTPNYGWRIVETFRRSSPWSGTRRAEWELSPDWSPRRLEIAGERAGREERAAYDVDPETGAVTGEAPDPAGGKPAAVAIGAEAPGPLGMETPGSMLAWIRSADLDVGGRLEVESPVVAFDDLRARPTPLVLERLPDRGLRMAFRCRIGLEPWWEIETDRRGLPLAWRRGDESLHLAK